MGEWRKRKKLFKAKSSIETFVQQRKKFSQHKRDREKICASQNFQSYQFSNDTLCKILLLYRLAHEPEINLDDLDINEEGKRAITYQVSSPHYCF